MRSERKANNQECDHTGSMVASAANMAISDIIVIGASAGGVEALKRLVSGLSPDLPAAVFIVLHIGAHPSILPEILRSAGPLPAEHAIDGARIEMSRIYVAPPDHHLILAPGHMHVARGPKENNARPSINTLFRTAARTYRDRVVGVVLTGNLNDGTVGLWEIKRHGGVTVVQDLAEAAFPSMPRSAWDNVQIDYSLRMDQMASTLSLLASEKKTEIEMETRPEMNGNAPAFSGLTCPECRGPVWEQEYGRIKEFRCRVGHAYSFESMVEQHAVTTERALWTAVLAMEEEIILKRQAAERAVDQESRREYEREAQAKERQAGVIREMLTQPDLSFSERHATA
jgi:two-component system, chemotaxis family, protein-glutamate methylesterase/glutaminase